MLHADKIQVIESSLRTVKTTHLGWVLDNLDQMQQHYQRLTAFYDRDFNEWKFWNYSGRQRAEVDVSLTCILTLGLQDVYKKIYKVSQSDGG